MTPALLDALADGATAVTPNRRLARQLRRAFDRRQIDADHRTWRTPAIVPYPAWLVTLWQTRREAHGAAGARTLLSAAQSQHLWRRIVEDAAMGLFDTRGAATLAMQAWTLMHAWGEGGESWRAWTRSGNGDDPSMFAAWAQSYARALARHRSVDAAQLGDVLAAEPADGAARGMHATLVGFMQITPQQQRLIDALTRRGARIDRDSLASDSRSTPRRVLAPTARDELRAALAWARERSIADPGAAIGIIVEDLTRRRDQVIALADEILCPALCLPAGLGVQRPYEISLGASLAEVPLVASALGLIALAEGSLPAGEAAALLRCRYLPDAERAADPRARIELDWLEAGHSRITFDDAVAALGKGSMALAQRWRAARARTRRRAHASPREWGDAWRGLLADAGWPGSLTLDSAEYQARETWDATLTDFMRIGVVTARMSRDEALQSLRALTTERVFQPEGGDASIQILGMLEGSGLEFDALWVAGLSADRWPRPPEPNPLLPLDWQRARGVPRSTAQGELDYALTVTRAFAAAAGEVVFSSPARVDDYPMAPSAALLDYPSAPLADVVTASASWTDLIAATAALESLDDDRAPALEPGVRAPGGAGIVNAQSECPFRAVAKYRLRVDRWPEPLSGLSPLERGKIVHLTLSSFWDRTRDHSNLIALSAYELTQRIADAVADGRDAVPASRWSLVPGPVRRAETQRLAAVLEAWLSIEREREPFSVHALEGETSVELAGHRFRLRVDRVDALEGGGVAIIDYKSNVYETPRVWFSERPRGVQLGMYALAQRAAEPDAAVRAALFACLRADEIEAIGFAMDAGAWPGLKPPEPVQFPDWNAVEAWWKTQLDALADEISAGWSPVAPRESPSPCKICRLQSLCRIDSVRHADDDGLDDA
ncbi:MAG: PD-(D/E)XK nuclease family protein [Betaproteobacteria bacterium]